MTIMDDGIRLNAKLDMPVNGAKRCPLVVFFHGFTGFIEEEHIVAIARGMNEAGFATLRVDLYGHGESDGEFRNHTLYKWLNNAMAAVDYARGLDFATDLFLCGHSQGGLLVMLLAALEHDRIRGLIPLSPACMIPELARSGELLGLQFDPDRLPDELDSWDGRKLDSNYVRVAQSIDVDSAIRRYTGPVLIVHGDDDEAVPFEYGKRAAEAYADATLAVIPGDDHCYTRHLDQVVEAVKEWLRKF